MSFDVFFSFSSGLKRTLWTERGTLARITSHVENVEKTLGITRYTYNRVQYWRLPKPSWSATIPDAMLCDTVEAHNQFVMQLYAEMREWSPRRKRGLVAITPKAAARFWCALDRLDVPVERWTREYYTNRMEELYEVMRGRPTAGMEFDADALPPKTCAAIIRLFDQYLDAHDLRLDVPRGCDHLASSDDGGYEWCDKCGEAINPDEPCKHIRSNHDNT